jgi:hypothetical protein
VKNSKAVGAQNVPAEGEEHLGIGMFCAIFLPKRTIFDRISCLEIYLVFCILLISLEMVI